jgi:exopolysaccharide biosynthesis polyprenyl glycosylphosphotransferase
MFVRLRRLIILLALADGLGAQLALWAADLARRWLPLGAPLGEGAGTFLNPVIHLIVALVFPATFLALSVYDVRRDTRPVGDPMSVTRAAAVGVFVFAGVLYFSYRDVPRLLVIYFFFLLWGTLAVIRLSFGLGLRLLRRQGRPLSQVLLVGAGDTAAAVAAALTLRLGDSVHIVGCADDTATQGPAGLAVLGQLADVPKLVESLHIDEVILALPAHDYEAVEALAFVLLTRPVRVRLVPDYLRLVVVQSSVESLDGLPLIGLREPRLSGMTWALKRVFDVMATTLALALAWPLMLVIALAIRLDSPGPIFLRQQRVGENGRLFAMYKFRTMRAEAVAQPADAPQRDAEGRPIYKVRDDARVTRLGRFLRRTSLDELPQLFNVVRGEMSLVGPRPELLNIVENYEPWQRQRLAVPPGLTGWWQVSGRSDLPMHLNTHLDLYYIRNYSLWLDLKILWRTIWVVLQGKGAY